jgi:hypothetical protein
VAVVALLCILALSAAAATLDSSRQAGGAGQGGVATSDPGLNRTPAVGTPPTRTTVVTENRLTDVSEGVCPPLLGRPLLMGLVLVLVVGSVVAVAHVREWGLPIQVVGVLSAVPLLMVWLGATYAFTGCRTYGEEVTANSTVGTADSLARGTPATGGGEAVTTAPDPSILMLAAVGVVLVAAVAVIVRGTGDDDAGRTEGEEADDDEQLAAGAVASVAATAGEAADRIEASGDLDNEVYRAWREMTTDLEVRRPASSTPAEFREAAVQAGMAPGHVDELTDLFEEVRYGGYAATEDREQRAVAALRQIERAYGDGGDRR